jgi:predicted nucleotidyltransferase
MDSIPAIEELERRLEEVRGIAAAFAKSVRGHFRERVASVTLYGSAIRGDWTPESDIDVLVLLDRVTPEDADVIAREALQLGLLDHGLLLQPVIMSSSQFEHLLTRERAYALSVANEGMAL